ncbi:hypothetical protein [Nonomuraea basaltis]|uniref:hypothetical protein n=1 Tax=Nonomuraea basaltis TaxID=2495887 RepID=UPI00110C5FC2|nr:hypothetical protein [Nonomuraea basaltis]TMR91887.1 hypothetical protein EJK15_47545 [Nonomuraea basaltis]
MGAIAPFTPTPPERPSQFHTAGRPAPLRDAAADPAVLGAPHVRFILIHGDQDQALPVNMARRYAAAHGAQVIEPPAAGHFDLINPRSAA